MHPYKRSARVKDLIREEVADIIMHKLKDPRLGFVTVTDIYMSVFEEEKKETSLKVLNSSAKFIRSELGKRIKIKFIPDLSFKLDESITYGAKIDQLLEEIQTEKGSSENDENPT
jgi:ribosome-binding factor A